ncbi:excinuclease ABC subunit UvrC [Proteiniclasticum sp. SCR006]|uniref:UvrABC system protein C n=1 Tax=Proteiniclasticum aestuarii TaxID=2817862 RepID=A0A939KK76_9CLOT|nr:excinuclease ABC subunit UvrC [Proteiniclasticum aestuarii]
MFDLEYQLSILPDNPGVYLMKNSLGEIIYVGKAKNLKKRVKSYFQNTKNHSEKTRVMVSKVAEFEYIITDSEMEALILEMNLIKKHSPRYNVLLKDDKHFPFIKITTNEDFPRVYMTRTYARDGNRYFGPYTDVNAVHETLDTIKKIYPIRTCRRVILEFGEPTKPCLNYHLGLCKAPCAGYISKAEYGLMIEDIINLLEGRDVKIRKSLKEEMLEASEALDFERAAHLRDKLFAIDKTLQKQKVFTRRLDDEDYIGIHKDEEDVSVQVFNVRDGKLTGREHYILKGFAQEEEEKILTDFIKSYYSGTAFVPKTIYSRVEVRDEVLADWLTMRRGKSVALHTPKRGDKLNMLGLAESNAKATIDQFKQKILSEYETSSLALSQLASTLELDDLPERIEAFDISNIQGVDSVGTMVVYEKNRFKRSDYRRFKIRTVKGANDYDSMREILTRRFKRGLSEVREIQERKLDYTGGKFSIFPDLIIMDGGKGQVNIALEVLRELDIEIPVMGLVKDDYHRTRGIIYMNREYGLRELKEARNLLTKIQDEVHRFAITYHRTLRDKKTLHSILEDIPRVGATRRKNLMLKFGSIDAIREASVEMLQETPSIDRQTAESIYTYFHGNGEEEKNIGREDRHQEENL